MNKAALFNRIWLLSCYPEYKRFQSGLNRVKKVQEKILLGYLKQNANTDYGRRYGYSEIRDYESFVKNVPLIKDWQQLSVEIEDLKSGKGNVLTNEELIAFEETSGSTGFSKLIPYTVKLRNEFNQAVKVWMFSLWQNQPKTFNGKAFWSISPALKERKVTSSGIRIGLDNDLEYLDSLSAKLMEQIMVTSKGLNRITHKHEFFIACLEAVLKAQDLSFISAWSPNYLLVLDDVLRQNFIPLLQRLEKSSPERYEALKILDPEKFTWKEIWPSLNCISCWTDAQAAVWLPALKEKTGDVFFQGKGLLSTEAVSSIPFGVNGEPILAYRSHFFEFRVRSGSEIKLAHQLEVGEEYEIIVSTGSGIMRYLTGDIIKVTKIEQSAPCFRFIGREGAISDMVGEKLSEEHVRKAIQEVWNDCLAGLKGVFFFPNKVGAQIYYVLALELDRPPDDINHKLAETESVLSRNPYYLQAMKSGQLQPLQFKLLAKGCSLKLKQYIQSTRKIKEGDLKLPLLIKDPDCISILLGYNEH